MVSHFLVEFRLHGYAKTYARELIYDVARKFKVHGVTRQGAVPHISLYGPSETKNIGKVAQEVERIGRKYSLVPFKIKGFDYFDNKNNKVVFLDITPSILLEELRWELAQSINKLIIPPPLPKDTKQKFEFHSTIAFKDIDTRFNKIWDYIKSVEEPNINQHLLRVTILQGGRIFNEYDLMLRELLNRSQSLSDHKWHQTISKFREMQRTHQMQDMSIVDEFKAFIKKWIS